MPSRKQRRRRQKERRHDYEYVYVDDEGHEVEVDEPDAEPRAATSGGGARRSTGSAKAPARGGRAKRPVEAPSWRRVGRRALFVGPVLVLLMFLIRSKQDTTGDVVVRTIFFMLVFLPFSYVMDSMLYRSYLKRTGQAPPPRARRTPKA